MHVHLIFKTHLDIGFTDLARNVVARYFEEFIPAAIRVAAELRECGGEERFIWTTGSWLIYEYFERASPGNRRLLENAIEAGDIAWHGLPFTTHTELMTRSLFRHGLSLSERLDARFGRQTISAKMTDVPGHTRAMIPLLAEAGIEFLHIGVNPASMPPAVPELFQWRDPHGSGITVMYDQGDYGGTTVVPAACTAVCFAHTRDNEPPQTASEVIAIFRDLQTDFPSASCRASTLCDVAKALRPHVGSLPIVQAEIGDSWIYGAAADPARITPFRAASRVYTDWIEVQQADPLAPDLDAFARHLSLVPEHTWGMLVESLEDEVSTDGLALAHLRATDRGRQMEASWDEQRSQIPLAVGALSEPRRGEVEHSLEDAEAKRWSTDGWTFTQQRAWPLQAFEVTVSETGALSHIRQRDTDRTWACNEATLGQFVYESFDTHDYERFFEHYVKLDVDWARRAYTRHVPRDVVGTAWTPTLKSVFTSESADAFRLLCELRLPQEAIVRFGAPPVVQALWSFPRDGAHVSCALQWFGKQATRLPTAAWLSFQPLLGERASWQLHKLGAWIPVEETVEDGGRMFHGFDRGVRCKDGQDMIQLESLDAPIVSPARRNLLRFDHRPQLATQGMHFCLWNNVWNTNFPLWHARDERFRFNLIVDGNDES